MKQIFIDLSAGKISLLDGTERLELREGHISTTQIFTIWW